MSSQPTVKPQDLESVIGDLDGALAWLQTLGIQPDRTRFSEYRNTLDIVRKYRVAGKLKELPAIVPPEQCQQLREVPRTVLHDAVVNELVTIVRRTAAEIIV